MESDDHYRHADSKPIGDEPDFSAGLLDLCRGLEMLLNEKLGAISAEIARNVLGDTQASSMSVTDCRTRCITR